MKINKNIVPLFTILTFWLVACSNNTNVVAIVNRAPITQKTYEGTLDNLILQQKKNNPNFVDNKQTRLWLGKIALEQMITNEVLFQEAQKMHITVKNEAIEQSINNLKQILAIDENGQIITDKKQIDDKFNKKLKTDGVTLKQLKENIRKELSVKLFLKDLSDKQKIEISEDVLKKFYDGTMAVTHKDQSKIQSLSKEDLALITPFAAETKKVTAERVTISPIFLATPETMDNTEATHKKDLADKIAQELRDNKIAFIQAIQMYSDDKSTLRTNGEQIIIRGTLPHDLDEKIFEARLGEVIGPIMQQEGIYILRVNEKRAANTLTYEQLRRDIINYLISVALQQKIQQQVKDLVQQAKIQILVPEYKVNNTQATSN